MVRRLYIYQLVIFTLVIFIYGRAHSQVPNTITSNDEIIVKLKYVSKFNPNYDFLGKAHAEKGLQLKKAWQGMGLYHFKAEKGKPIAEALSELRQDPEVEYAEPNYVFDKASVGDIQIKSADDVMSQAAGPQSPASLIQSVSTWPLLSASTVPVVAVIDTGLDMSHSVFVNSGAVWTNPNEIPSNGIDDDHNGYVDDIHGWNFVSNSPTMIDDDGHGTHVAGIVLGVSQNIFATSVSPAQIRIMPLKFLDGNGSGKTSDAIEAIYYAVANGATVLNNSWGGGSYSAALHEAITYAYNNGVIFVAAAGNNGTNNDASPMYPASYDVPNIIAVAATTEYDSLAGFSNFGAASVSLGSPGSAISSTYPGNTFASMYGTSMAAPFVSGAAALMKAEQPNLLGYQAKQIIYAGSDYQSSLNGKVNSNGRLNVLQSVSAAQSASIDSTQPAYTFSNQDRALASSMTSSGCGLVTKMYRDSGRGGSGGTPGTETWYIFLVVALLAIPMVVINYLKARNPENRRSHARYKINTEVKVQVGDKELVGSVSSISLGGVQINTEALLEQGGIVHMSIRSPDGKEALAVEGRVVWSEAKKAYGVQFQQTEVAALQRIQNWTKGLNKA